MNAATGGSAGVSPHADQNDDARFPFFTLEFPSIALRRWQDSGPPVHPQRHGGRPQLHLHCCHELPPHHGVLTPEKVPLEKTAFSIWLAVYLDVISRQTPAAVLLLIRAAPPAGTGQTLTPS